MWYLIRRGSRLGLLHEPRRQWSIGRSGVTVEPFAQWGLTGSAWHANTRLQTTSTSGGRDGWAHKHLVKWCHAITTRLATRLLHQQQTLSLYSEVFFLPHSATMMFLFISHTVNPSFSVRVDVSPLHRRLLMARCQRRWAVGRLGVHMWERVRHSFWFSFRTQTKRHNP